VTATSKYLSIFRSLRNLRNLQKPTRNLRTSPPTAVLGTVDWHRQSLFSQLSCRSSGMPSFYDGQAPSALNSVTDPCPSRIQVNRWWPARGQYDEGKEAATVDGLKKSSRQVRAAQLHKNPVIGRVAAAAHICSSHQAKVLPWSSHLWQSQSILHIRPGSIQVCNPRIRRGSYPVATHVQGGISHPE